VSIDVCVLQLQMVMRAIKSDGGEHRMDVGKDSTMMDGGR